MVVFDFFSPFVFFLSCYVFWLSLFLLFFSFSFLKQVTLCFRTLPCVIPIFNLARSFFSSFFSSLLSQLFLILGLFNVFFFGSCFQTMRFPSPCLLTSPLYWTTSLSSMRKLPTASPSTTPLIPLTRARVVLVVLKTCHWSSLGTKSIARLTIP